MAQGSIIKKELLLIGGSAGSLEAILQLLPAIQNEKGLAIVLVLHRRNSESLLPNLLSEKIAWPVKEAEEKETILAGTVYIAPADYHLLIENDKTISLDYSEKVHYSRPSIDVTFESAAEVYGESLIAILLSGANQDGSVGLKKIKEAGGYVIVQDPTEAVVSYMPQYAIDHVRVDAVLPVAKMPALIHELLP
ncbi:chemotaxis protein CheB [Flavisolibacter nicotianae]|uniref:chemotaxis protein CheB n=1 Tax=Flavisolibacter nicotianae TaxID=2364882 RepID=UPI000EAD0BD9|nr:chemotaxis protein CheB [Flavisolibacter nicotianae]